MSPAQSQNDIGEVDLQDQFRRSHGRVTAALTRRFGVQRFDLVENAIQDAYVRALERWPERGAPIEPERWLVRVAHNAMVDVLRREQAGASGEDLVEPSAQEVDDEFELEGQPVADISSPSEFEELPTEADDELRLMFLCCYPELTRAAQVALVLNVAFGLSARQIATSFVSDERTVAQRIVRAKQRIREDGVRFEIPQGSALTDHLSVMVDVLYLVFSEGANPTGGDAGIDNEFCKEALRLVRLLTESERTALPSAFALRALICFNASRLPARTADDGSLLLVPEQDRGKWDSALIEEGFTCLDRAGHGDFVSRYHVEAAIAACHAIASSYAETDWIRLVELYGSLREIAPSMVVDVNRALAMAMLSGAAAGLEELDSIPEREALARYPYALAAYADLHASLGNLQMAREFLDRALANQSSPAQQALLRRKRIALER